MINFREKVLSAINFLRENKKFTIAGVSVTVAAVAAVVGFNILGAGGENVTEPLSRTVDVSSQTEVTKKTDGPPQSIAGIAEKSSSAAGNLIGGITYSGTGKTADTALPIILDNPNEDNVLIRNDAEINAVNKEQVNNSSVSGKPANNNTVGNQDSSNISDDKKDENSDDNKNENPDGNEDEKTDDNKDNDNSNDKENGGNDSNDNHNEKDNQDEQDQAGEGSIKLPIVFK